MNVRRLLVLVLCFLSPVLSSRLNAQPDRVTGRAFATRSPVLGQHGMVCTSHQVVP